MIQSFCGFVEEHPAMKTANAGGNVMVLSSIVMATGK